MTDSKQQLRIINKIGQAWAFVPQWRLGQLISNLLGPGPQDVFHFSDDLLEECLDNFIKAEGRYAE